MKGLVIRHRPQLRKPTLVVGFGGWANAAEISTGVVNYLKNVLGARKLGEIHPEGFYSFAVARPEIVVRHGVIKSVEIVSNKFYSWRNVESDRDLILLQAIEPHLSWPGYVDCVLEVAERFSVVKVVTVGGFYDRVPHTRRPKVTAVVNDPALVADLEEFDIGLTEYEGPSSIHSYLLAACGARGIPGLSLWGHAPDYVQGVGNPRVCQAVVAKLSVLLNIDIDLEQLKGAGDYLDETLGRLLNHNPELQQHVRKLEDEYDSSGPARVEPLGKTTRILKEVEDFLRSEQRKRGKRPPEDGQN
ncbi:MAG: PAC2 family protein [Dehalococcoidia bacterium]|nr:PAC2 family protein [Dehalococcoidia bacterium]